MTVAAHTYAYYRTGVGDVIVLVPEGHPYVISAEVPSGWTANYWWASDSLASIHDLSKWTKFDPSGTVPPTAAKIATNVISAARTPESARLKVNISTQNYKAVSGLRYTDSGAHAAAFDNIAAVTPPDLPSLAFWYDFSDVNSLWTDVARTTHPTDGQTIQAVNNKGRIGGYTVDAASSLTFQTAVLNGQSVMEANSDNSWEWTDGVVGVSRPENIPSVVLNSRLRGWGMIARVVTIGVPAADFAFRFNKFVLGGELGRMSWFFSSGDWQVNGGQPTVNIDTNMNITAGEWVLVWGGFAEDGLFTYNVSGNVPATLMPSGPQIPIPIDGLIQFGEWNGQIAEIFVYDGLDLAAAQTDLEAYASGRYGALPNP